MEDLSDDEVTMMDVDPSIDTDSRARDGRGDEEEYTVQILTTQQVFQDMRNCIDEVNTVLKLPRTTVRLLLNHFNWNKDKLLEVFFDGDTEKLFKEAGIVSPTTPTVPPVEPSDGGIEICEICFVEWPSSSMHLMECGHRFCLQCWLAYLTSRIMDDGQGQFISCPGHKCPLLVPDDKVMELVTDTSVRLKYQQLITNSYVHQDRLVKWCPSPGCIHAIRVEFVKWKPVTCTCGHTFCFQCGNDWHEPVQCNLFEKWQNLMSDDQGPYRCSDLNIKKCPKCNSPIEKNGGCNHIVCGNQDCRMEFCWLCMRPMGLHCCLSCNRYQAAARSSLEKQQALQQRYEHYGTRHLNHKRSLGLEMKLYDSMLPAMQQQLLSWTETDFLKKAVDVLCQCRRTLSYSYIFAFFLEQNNRTLIFEDNQRDLEEATEKLSGYSERELTSKNLADIRQEVQDKFRYCESRRKTLLDHVHEGYDHDWWVYDANWTDDSSQSEAVAGSQQVQSYNPFKLFSKYFG